MKYKILAFACFILAQSGVDASLYNANYATYTSFLGTLVAGDTLQLAPGTYTSNLTLNGLSGTSTDPIVILGSGDATVFEGQSCCNTVSITHCEYIVIGSMKLDGLNQNVDAVKAEGTTGNWAHHVTIERLNIVNYAASQQNVGISTKCPAWNWVIRKNKLSNIGTGMYLGNSDGTRPFVNGLIEYNYIGSTVGYNIEIKHQIDTVRSEYPGTAVDGKTILRHNVFMKDSTSSTGGSARPNLLVGGFPPTGWGANDSYEIYGNFFYNNPVEALFQGTGNIQLYENVFVNHYDPAGYRAVYITPHNGVSPQDIKVFHNTVWAQNASGGIRLYSPNVAYQQYCYGNAVFAPSPITNFTAVLDNVTDTYANAGNYALSASSDLSLLNLYPQSGQLTGTLTPSALFQNDTDWDLDFNQDPYDWTYRGAYAGCCTNPGWQLQMDTMATPVTPVGIAAAAVGISIRVFPNPSRGRVQIVLEANAGDELAVYNLAGERVHHAKIDRTMFLLDLTDQANGVYLIAVRGERKLVFCRMVKE